MRQLRYLLRLHHDRVSTREIGRLLGVARSTIQDNLKRAAAAGLQWPLPEELRTMCLNSGCLAALILPLAGGVVLSLTGRRWRVN